MHKLFGKIASRFELNFGFLKFGYKGKKLYW